MAQAPFIINPALVAIANDYQGINMRRGYKADILIPRVRVDAPLFRYTEFPISEAFTVVDNQVGRLGRLNEVTQTGTETTGATKDYGLSEPIPYRDILAQSNQTIPFSLKVRAVKNIVNKNNINREIRAAALLSTLANYTSGYKTDLTAGTKWSDFTNSDPVALVTDAAATMLVPPNVAFMSLAVRNVLRRHPKVSVALGGSALSGRYVSDDELATAFGVERIVITNTLKQTSKRGQAVTTGKIWGDDFGLLYIAPVGEDNFVEDPDGPSFALTFQWGGHVSGEVPDPNIGLWGGTRVRDGESIVEKLVAPYAGYLFKAVL